ncbi:MAG: hypothetical protein K2M06_04935 [Muribaculaceae bacterium]|nr:hypothetical protein [Muribaculaceae bacterium]
MKKHIAEYKKMTTKLNIENLHCLCSETRSKGKIAYILYPMDILGDWIEAASEKHGVTIVVIMGMDWQNVFSPWPAPGVPKGDPDFKGESPEFLRLLQERVIPQIESELGIDGSPERSLIGVSMSGLFALWQWMVCDTFANIASLSGSFWYEGLVDWLKTQTIPTKQGKGYFLLGDKEPKSRIKIFATVGAATEEIIEILRTAGIEVEFQSVPGNHYSDPLPRLNMAFATLYGGCK